jgi:hypothetical protein
VKYAIEMGSSATIYIPNFIKIGSGIRKLMGVHKHRQHGDRISLLQESSPVIIWYRTGSA